MDTDPCKISHSNVGHKDAKGTAQILRAPPDPLAAEMEVFERGILILGRSGANFGDAAELMLHGVNDTRHLAAWARRYLAAEVIGAQSPNTVQAKPRDLSAFVRWFTEANGHATAAQWMPRDTQSS